MSALKTRLLVGTLLVLLVAGLFATDLALGVAVAVPPLICLLGLAGFLEFARLARLTSAETPVGRWTTVVGLATTAYFLAAAWWLETAGAGGLAARWLLPAGLAGFLVLAFARLAFLERFLDAFPGLLSAFLGVVLFGLLYSFVLRVYLHGDDVEGSVIRGAVFFLAVKGTDIAAYLVGSAIGRRHFTRVSPKKTLEGSASGIIFCSVWLCGAALCWPQHFFGWPWALLFGIILSLTSQLGDLTESVLKRYYGVKDSSALLPEFGGVLDLTDSFLFSGFFFWCLLPS